MRLVRPVLFVGAALLVGLLIAVTLREPEPEREPDEVVRAMVSARVAGQCDGFDSYFVDGDAVVGCGDPQPVVGPGPVVGAAQVDDDEAVVPVTDLFDCSTWDEAPHEYVDEYRLVLADGDWRIAGADLAEPTSDDCLS